MSAFVYAFLGAAFGLPLGIALGSVLAQAHDHHAPRSPRPTFRATCPQHGDGSTTDWHLRTDTDPMCVEWACTHVARKPLDAADPRQAAALSALLDADPPVVPDRVPGWWG